ncbi:MAG TPA: ABC transporter substrate-binding protein [Thermodesulfobacteriota bacterium]|jgi:ABC-type branched-subunit amino acid transport system substrate-binding protein|nr:ABC transporter substrate-binding protein [Thermodesulfobacteriota bacterium]
MKVKIVLITLVLILLLTVPWLVVHAQKAKPTGEPVKIGVLLPYTGPVAWVTGCVVAVDLAIKEINEAGGIHGRPVVKVEADTEAKADAAVAGARKLMDVDKVLAIIGPTSITIRSVIPLGVERKILIISPTAGTTALDKDPQGGKIVYRTVSSDTVMGSGMVYYALKLGAKKVALFFEDTESAASIKGVVTPACQVKGLPIVGEVVITPGAPSYRSELLRITKDKPDVILYELSPPEGAIVFKEWTELGLKGQWIGTDFVNDKFAEVTWPASKGVIGVNPGALISPRYEAWVKDLQALTGKPGVPQFADNAYDAMNIIALALEASKEVNREAILSNIRKVSSAPGKKVANFAEGAKLLRQGQKIDYDGIAGSQDFDEYGNAITYLKVVQIEDGKLKRIGTLTDKEVAPIMSEVLKLRK